ncbi:MAG TPA: VWA domain-containing protein [Longimicrobiales bacterium]
MSFGFENPWALLLLPALLAAVLYGRRRWRRPRLTFSRAEALAGLGAGRAEALARLPDVLRLLLLVSLVLALAGPRTGVSAVDVDAEGIAIVLAVDISSSMLAEDFQPRNRLAVAKEKVISFIRGRRYDRIGMVAFAGEALTQVPITMDYDVLYRAIEQLEVGTLEDGTAIGTAIATAANRLRRAPGESRVIILMTDGENNRGEVDPLTAAQAAAAFGIKIYAIGVGTEGVAPIPVRRGMFGGYEYANLPVHIDEELLGSIAEITGGRYFRATNEAALDSIYRQIDQLEKTEVEVRRYTEYTPRHLPLLLMAATLLLAEWGLRASRWGRVP